MDNCCCKMSKSIKMVIKGLHVRAQKVTWAGTQCSEFFSQARHILCEYSTNFVAMGLNSFTVFNILICVAWK